jgi:hypothetical protein
VTHSLHVSYAVRSNVRLVGPRARACQGSKPNRQASGNEPVELVRWQLCNSVCRALVVGLARNTPNFAYLAGYYLPVTLVAVVLGVWRAPKWQAAQRGNKSSTGAATQAPDLRA